MTRIPKARNGDDKLKRSRRYYREGYSPRPILMKADYSIDTSGYSVGKKKFPATVTRTEVKNPSKTTTTQETIRRPRVKQMIKKQRSGGSTPAWQRKEGKNPSGGLNAKGRASYNRANPGKPGLKAPQPQGGPRKRSFCARMSGMKKKLTSAKTANDPNSRINKSLRKWKC